MWNQKPSTDLDQRLKPFVERGMLAKIPNRWQRLQGQCSMTPFVLSPDVTAERFYRDSWLANPVVRQPFLLRLVGVDHFNTGTGLSNRLVSICRHLQLTWHEGMPAFDLQIVQTHADGLPTLRRSMLALMDPQTDEDRRIRRQADRLFPDPNAYFAQFTEPGGWIDQAEAFDYPTPADLDSDMPEEFFSLVGFLNYCGGLPEHPQDVGWGRVPGHLVDLSTRRWRQEAGKRWFFKFAGQQA